MTGVDTVAAHARAARPRGDARRAPRAPATRWRGCSRPTSRTRRSTTCSPTSWRCSPDAVHARPANGLAFRLKLLARGRHRAAARRVRLVRRERAPRGILGRRRRGRLRRVRGGAFPLGAGDATSSCRRARRAAGAGAGGVGARAAPGERAITETPSITRTSPAAAAARGLTRAIAQTATTSRQSPSPGGRHCQNRRP